MSQQKQPRLTDPRRHILPAHFTWLLENFTRVYISAVTSHKGVDIPPGTKTQTQPVHLLVEGGAMIVHTDVVTLNFGVEAVGKFSMDENGVSAEMRFNGKANMIFFPWDAVIRVYSPDDEEGAGLLNVPLYYDQAPLHNGYIGDVQNANDQQEVAPKRERPTLKVVK